MKILIGEENKAEAATKPEETNPQDDLEESVLSFVVAVKYIEEDEIPIQGHGLIMLTKLVKLKDEETVKNIEKVLKIFQV